MNVAQQINKWIDTGCKFEEGVAIYEAHGTNSVLKDLFKKFKSRYYNEKLYEELINIKVNFEAENTIVPVVVRTQKTPYEDLPQKLQFLEREKSRLYRQILHNRKLLKKRLKLKTNGQITMAEALEEMAHTDKYGRMKPFSITYISFNKRTGKGGQVISYPNCYLKVLNNTGSKTIRNKKRIEARQPNHWKNSTRNIEPIGSGEIRKFHIWLMIEFNGKEVVISDLG